MGSLEAIIYTACVELQAISHTVLCPEDLLTLLISLAQLKGSYLLASVAAQYGNKGFH